MHEFDDGIGRRWFDPVQHVSTGNSLHTSSIERSKHVIPRLTKLARLLRFPGWRAVGSSAHRWSGNYWLHDVCVLLGRFKL
jgi:hypothetical protein